MMQGEFELLTRDKQVDYLYTHGTFLGKRRSGPSPVVIYQAESFYVEIHYFKYRQHISRMCISNDIALLDPYLEQVDVRELDKLLNVG